MVAKDALVYLFDGEEDFLKEEALGRLERELLSEETRDLNIASFRGQDADGAAITNQLRTSPFLSPKKLIILKDAQRLAPSTRDSLISYIKNPSKSTCLLIMSQSIKRDDPLYQAVACHGRVVSFPRMYGEKIDRWICERVRTYGKKMPFGAAAVLRENIGGQLSSLAQAIEKIITYVGARSDISVEDVESVTAKSIRYRIFDLTNAIGRKDRAKALEVLSGLLQDGRRPPEIINMLFWQLKRIQRARTLLAQGVSREKVGRNLNVHNFFLEDFINQTHNFPAEELDKAFELLLEAERDCRFGGLRVGITLELLVERLCG